MTTERAILNQVILKLEPTQQDLTSENLKKIDSQVSAATWQAGFSLPVVKKTTKKRDFQTQKLNNNDFKMNGH